jgi:electron transfer flavoprotein alpha subunit
MATNGTARAIRPVANGYLFEEVVLNTRPTPIVLFLPSVLFDTEPDRETTAPVTNIPFKVPADDLKTRTVKVIEAAPEDLDLEEADIIVAGGRGIGKGEPFDIIHALARAIGASVGGTRPVIDWGVLPYERQIGQTGKYVSPRLIINCGISGANEYTAGMEKSQQVIAIDLNPRARMFRFADLGIIGDAHEILPLLISRIEGQK